jgi:hypothetical protein
MADHQQSEHRPRRQGGGQRRNNYQRRQGGGDQRNPQRDTYTRDGEATDYTPPLDRDRRKTFGGGEYERVYRDKPKPKTSLGRRILKIVSFGILGKDKPTGKPAPRSSGSSERGGRDKDRQRGDRQQRPQGERRQSSGGNRDAKRNSEPSGPPREKSAPQKRPQPTERPVQPVNLEAITSPRLHLGNLSYETTESDLFELFNGVGKVTNAEIVTHSRTQRSKGFGFIQLTTIEEAKRAAEEFHGKPFMGRVMIVGPAKGNRPENDRRDADDEIKRPEEE